MSNQKGFLKIAIIIIALILIGGAYFVFSKKDRNISVQETERQIDFVETKTETNSGNIYVSKTDKKDIIDNWKTYKNEKYEFEFKYPKEFKIINESEGEEKYYNQGACSTYYKIVLNNPLFTNMLWEAGTVGRIPALKIEVRKDDCPLDINQPLTPQTLKIVNELLNMGIDRQKISEVFSPGGSSYGWNGNVKRLPEDSCKEISVIKVDTKHYAVKALECFDGPIHPITRASFIPNNGFILTMEDEASRYQEGGIFDRILSTFKFTK